MTVVILSRRTCRIGVVFSIGLLLAPRVCLAQVDSSCGVATWSSSRRVTGLGAHRIDNISLSVGGHETVFAGSPDLMFRRDTTSLHATSKRGAWLRVAPLNGKPLPPLAGDFMFVDPQVAIDGHDRVHVVWGEPRPGAEGADAPSLSALEVVSLWHAMWSGSAWSKPTQIQRANRISWNRFQSSRLVVDGHDELHLSVPLLSAHFEPSVAYLHFDTESWSSHSIAAPATVMYTDVASLPDGGVAVAFVAAGLSMREGPSENELFVTTSSDHGITWTPLQVGAKSQAPAYSPRMTVDGSGRLHLVWIQLDHSGTGMALWHRVSANGGRDWSETSRAPLDRQVRNPSIAVDASGVLHVAVQYQTPRGPNILYGRVEHGEWTPLVQPFRETVNTAPLLWRGRDSRIHMLRYQAPVVANWPAYYELVSAVLGGPCPRS